MRAHPIYRRRMLSVKARRYVGQPAGKILGLISEAQPKSQSVCCSANQSTGLSQNQNHNEKGMFRGTSLTSKYSITFVFSCLLLIKKKMRSRTTYVKTGVNCVCELILQYGCPLASSRSTSSFKDGQGKQ
ncbi:uncharacterized protein [Lolium perenne]|uniref:uncharacterized protein isoform X1 n=1 Tax=Lolium perenne TaxID=4522 RepID=UPI003A997E93